MKVNKKKLAEIFNVDPRTIERWQSQGLSCVSGGSKGVESVFDTAMAIQWYAQRETDIENEKLRKELEDLRAAAESDLQPGTIDYERYRLTKAQADAQELKNAREEGLVLETELFTFILQRVAQEISGILVRVPLTLQRKYLVWQISFNQTVTFGMDPFATDNLPLQRAWLGVAPEIGRQHVDDYRLIFEGKPRE
ncbi:terminase small subunit [Escherichia coli]|uniref:terminase small subunit n=6 Tax=Escherichia coli TaxID=562 RepID=UPI00358DD1AF